MTNWLNDWLHEGTHLRKSESKPRDQLTLELRDRSVWKNRHREIPAALKAPRSSAASSVWNGSGTFFQTSFRWKTQGWVLKVSRMFKVSKWQERRAVQEGTKLRDQGPERVKDWELCQRLYTVGDDVIGRRCALCAGQGVKIKPNHVARGPQTHH